jgi:multiple sugar transport system ATP-binding protein
MNLFRATLDRREGAPVCALVDQQVVLPQGFLEARPKLARWLGREVAVGIRSEHLQDGTIANAAWPRLRADVTLIETLGPERQVHLRLAALPVVTDEVLDVVRDMDSSMAAELSEHAGESHTRAIARFEADADVAEGQTREVAVAPDKLRFFDLDTGSAIQ